MPQIPEVLPVTAMDIWTFPKKLYVLGHGVASIHQHMVCSRSDQRQIWRTCKNVTTVDVDNYVFATIGHAAYFISLFPSLKRLRLDCCKWPITKPEHVPMVARMFAAASAQVSRSLRELEIVTSHHEDDQVIGYIDDYPLIAWLMRNASPRLQKVVYETDIDFRSTPIATRRIQESLRLIGDKLDELHLSPTRNRPGQRYNRESFC